MNLDQHFENIQHYLDNLNFVPIHQLAYYNYKNDLYVYILLEQDKILVYQGNKFLGDTSIDVKELDIFLLLRKRFQFNVKEPELKFYVSSSDLRGGCRGKKTKVAPDYDNKIDKGNTIYLRKRKDI